MKKTTLGFLMVLLGVYSASARQINPDEALSVASDFMSSSELKISKAVNSSLRPMKAPGVDGNASVSPYYIFNRGENEGFVIISGDDRVPKILGYSDKGSFNVENMPPQLKNLMEQWATQMNQLPESASQHISWNKSATTRSGEGILMETAEWGQGYPYNAYSPVIEGVQAPAGCVATAMAIAMKYHNWPDYTRGGIQDDFNYPEFSFDFDKYSIDWNVLEDKTNPRFADEVGKLMYTTGVAAQMMYGPYESSAEMWPLGHKMVELYTYAKGCQYIEKEKFNDDEWNRMLLDQLQEVGPVIYRGSGSVGHAFVIDGYDGDSLFHVNWGWDGLLNGYYTLDFSDVGGSSFNEFQGMIINITPDRERREYSKMFIPNCDVYIAGGYGCEGWNFMKSDIEPGDQIQIKVPSFALNGHVGYYDIAIVDDDDNILQILDMGFHNNDPNRHCPYPGQSPVAFVTFPELKAGQRYQLVSMEAPLSSDGWFSVPKSDDPKDWRIVLGGIVYPSYFYDKGNRSVKSEVRFHIDEKMPIVFPNFLTQDREFTLYKLKGGDCAENIIIPKKGVSAEITCTDKDGNAEIPLVNGSIDDSGVYGINISMYSDKFDVYLNYEYDGDTRNDKGIDSNAIIVQDGLIYKIVDNGVSLIGYDGLGSDVIIPESIIYGESVLPIVNIENDALLYAPIKNLTIRNSANIGVFAFCGMENIESLSIEGGIPDASWHCPFMNTKLKKVYFDRADQTKLMNSIITLNWDWFGELNNATLFNDNIDFYLSEVGKFGDSNFYIDNLLLYGIELALREGWIDKAMNSYNIPGIGDDNEFFEIQDLCQVNVKQMWKYAIDRDNNLIAIEPLIEDIKIKSVFVNGNAVEIGENFRYEIPATDDIEVIVNYILHDRQEMKTVYNADYNDNLPSQNLSTLIQVESITLTPDNWNGEEGETFKIEAIVMPEDATDKSLVWTSSDETVATVDGEGNVSVLKEGTCIITASAADGSGVSAECIITSLAGVEGIFSAEDNFDVYGLNGVLLKKNADRDGLKTLTPGIYMIRQGCEMKKLVIR